MCTITLAEHHLRQAGSQKQGAAARIALVSRDALGASAAWERSSSHAVQMLALS